MACFYEEKFWLKQWFYNNSENNKDACPFVVIVIGMNGEW
jgi:hypothetical protein